MRFFVNIARFQRVLRRQGIFRANRRKHLFKRVLRAVTSQFFKKFQRTERKGKSVFRHLFFQLQKQIRLVFLRRQPHRGSGKRVRIVRAVRAAFRRLHLRHHIAFQYTDSVVICVLFAKIIVKIGNKSKFFHTFFFVLPCARNLLRPLFRVSSFFPRTFARTRKRAKNRYTY